jgi:hypothetical protein
MSFIDKFLDLTTPLPREIVRNLKLLRVVEERYKEVNNSLETERDKYLQKIKEKEVKTNDIISVENNIDKYFKESLTLSDYKQEILKELKYIFEKSFLNKLDPIIEEGQKEIQEQLKPTNFNDFVNPLNNKNSNDDLKSESSEKKKKKDNFIGLKKNRPKNKKKGPGMSLEYSEETVHSIQDGDIDKQEIYCKCKRPSFGKMIECERCKEWFHYECVKLPETLEPKVWYCASCIEKKNEKLEKQKKKKKINN